MRNDRNALIGEIRRFTRFYIRTVGLLDETYSAAIWEELARQSGWDFCVADNANLAA